MRKRVIGVLLTVVMSLTVVLGVSASTQEQITNVQAEQEAAESDLAEAQNKITDLESEKSELENYLNELNVQLTELEASLTALSQQISEKEVELEMLGSALGRAREQETRQYEDMKVRIRYMYENGNTNLLTTLLQSESITEFLNRAETISKLTTYDREQLNTYKETKESIEEQEFQISEEKKNLESLKAESERKQAELAVVARTTNEKIAEYTSMISQEELNASNLQEKITQQQEQLKKLQAQAEAERQAAEEKAAAEAEARRLAEQKAAEEAAKQQSSAPSGGTSNQDTSNKSDSDNSSNESSAGESAGDSSSDSSTGTYLGKFKLTAYCACSRCCGKWANGVTASGTTATPGRTVAMAGVPFGTKLLINGNVYVVEDRGTSYGHVDVFFNSHSAALKFGLQYADVYQLN